MKDYILLIFLILLIIYNVMITQTLPKEFQYVIRNPVFKVFILIMIFCLALHYPGVALLLLIAYVLTHSYSKTTEESTNIIKLV